LAPFEAVIEPVVPLAFVWCCEYAVVPFFEAVDAPELP
jgi:hypothetical protein